METISTIHPGICLSTETGSIGIMHLKRYWEKAMARITNQLSHSSHEEDWTPDNALLSVLGLGIHQTLEFLYVNKPSFDEFENWILAINGGTIAMQKINQFNTLILEGKTADASIDNTVLSDADIDFWNENGYVIVREAASREDCETLIQAICEYINIDRNDPATWYLPHPKKQGIMVQMFQHPIIDKNRNSPRIRTAFEQLWGRKDIWVNADKVGFNPPETPFHKFQASPLHWDVSIKPPIPFGVQGILYLTDTKENQGAFTVVPGFHNKVEDWVKNLPAGTNPREQDLYQLGPKPIAANAGDFIIWHQALPHAASPNNSDKPRFVQYLKYEPLDAEINKEWL